MLHAPVMRARERRRLEREQRRLARQRRGSARRARTKTRIARFTRRFCRNRIGASGFGGRPLARGRPFFAVIRVRGPRPRERQRARAHEPDEGSGRLGSSSNERRFRSADRLSLRRDGATARRRDCFAPLSAPWDRRDAELRADRSGHADADLPMTRNERLRARLGVPPCIVAAPPATGNGLDPVGAQPALQLCALHPLRVGRR